MEIDLWNVLRTNTLTEEHVQFYMYRSVWFRCLSKLLIRSYQILRAVKYVHGAGILIRNLVRIGSYRSSCSGFTADRLGAAQFQQRSEGRSPVIVPPCGFFALSDS